MLKPTADPTISFTFSSFPRCELSQCFKQQDMEMKVYLQPSYNATSVQYKFKVRNLRIVKFSARLTFGKISSHPIESDMDHGLAKDSSF
jgi:hypothetical protein